MGRSRLGPRHERVGAVLRAHGPVAGPATVAADLTGDDRHVTTQPPGCLVFVVGFWAAVFVPLPAGTVTAFAGPAALGLWLFVPRWIRSRLGVLRLLDVAYLVLSMTPDGSGIRSWVLDKRSLTVIGEKSGLSGWLMLGGGSNGQNCPPRVPNRPAPVCAGWRVWQHLGIPA